MAEKCCFCIGLRAGTIVIALLIAIFSTAAALASFTAHVTGYSYFSLKASIVLGIAYVFKALVGFGGLYGAIARNQKFIRTFALLVGFMAVLAAAMATVELIYLFQNRDTLQSVCEEKLKDQADTGQDYDPSSTWTKPWKRQSNGTNNQNNSNNSSDIPELCIKFIRIYYVVYTIAEIVTVLITAYFARAILRFNRQLKTDERRSQLHKDLEESKRVIGRSNLSTLSDESEDSDENEERKLPRGIHSVI